VDDELAVLDGFRLALRKEPYQILTASSPAAALDLLARHAVDIVVSDERMPGGSGAAFLGDVRRSYPSILRIVLTGEADLKITTPLIQRGELYRFLTKPVSADDLARTLRHALQHKLVADEASRAPHRAGSGI
jgi:DNA-binding NtrC family response regulator